MNLKYKSLPAKGNGVNIISWEFTPKFHADCRSSNGCWCSFLAHASDIDDLLEGLDGVLENWLDGLHDTESSLHIVDLWLHALDGLHLSGDLN